MIALAFSAALAGTDAHVVRLPDRALNEPRERIRALVVNSVFGFPPGPGKQ